MKPPPSRAAGLLDLTRRQWLAALLAAAGSHQLACWWRVPRWAQSLAEAGTDATHALQSLTAEAAGAALFGFGATGIACTVYNRLRQERLRRAGAAGRELAMLASLGQASRPFFHYDRIDPR